MISDAEYKRLQDFLDELERTIRHAKAIRQEDLKDCPDRLIDYGMVRIGEFEIRKIKRD